MLAFVFLAVLQGAAHASFAGEWVDSTKYTAGVATHPTSLVKKALRDVKDFEQFPDKSKLPQKCFTEQELATYDGEDGRPVYLAISGIVYDFTAFADLHPGGPAPLKKHSGSDATAVLCSTGLPPDDQAAVLKRFQVGTVLKYCPICTYPLWWRIVDSRILQQSKDKEFRMDSVWRHYKLSQASVIMGEPRYTFADVRARDGRSGSPVWIVYRDSVYDVTSYLAEHPGGDVISEEAGTDATKAFDEVGHSSDARTILAKYKIGEIVEEEKVYDVNGKKKKKVVHVSPDAPSRSCMGVVTCGLLG